MPHRRTPSGRARHQEHLSLAYAQQETREILQHQRAVANERRLGLHSRYPDVLICVNPEYGIVGTGQFAPRARDHEKLGAHHWRNLHKNLARPRLRTRRLVNVQ